MNFKVRLYTLIFIVTCLCSSILTFILLFSEKVETCEPCLVKECTTSNTFGEPIGKHVFGHPSLDGWVRDCITWNRRLRIPVQQEIHVRNFTVPSSIGSSEGETDRKLTFKKIFTNRDWPADDPSYHGLKVSGPGAMLRRAQGAIATLHSIVTRVRSMYGTDSVSLLDIPCGDLQWMPSFLDSRPDVIYTGADIVPDIIEHHRRKFSRLNNASFVVHDIVSSSLKKSYDIVLVRDLLQHLWLADAAMALKRISDSGSRFLLATTYTGTLINEDVDRTALGGRKSDYNLELPPFSLESPICTSYDWNTEKLGLWMLPLKQKVQHVKL